MSFQTTIQIDAWLENLTVNSAGGENGNALIFPIRNSRVTLSLFLPTIMRRGLQEGNRSFNFRLGKKYGTETSW